MLKILQARLQQYVNRELPDVQAGFRKGRGTEIKLPTSSGSSKKQESSRKASISVTSIKKQKLTTLEKWQGLVQNGVDRFMQVSVNQ